MSHKNVMYSLGDIINNYLIFVWGQSINRFPAVITLKCTEISNHYVVYKKLTQCLKSIILQKQTNS